MRMHLLFPLAFLSGVHGFLMFVPYLLLIVVVGHIGKSRRWAATVAVAKNMQSVEIAEVASRMATA